MTCAPLPTAVPAAPCRSGPVRGLRLSAAVWGRWYQRLPDVGGDGHGDTAASGDALGYLPQADIPAGVDDDGAARQALVCGADADRGGVDPLSRGLRDHRDLRSSPACRRAFSSVAVASFSVLLIRSAVPQPDSSRATAVSGRSMCCLFFMQKSLCET
ncbi:hypothetical protein PSJ72_06595 [Escherichia coli]|nr:hypothetical protein [Escherichia coli]